MKSTETKRGWRLFLFPRGLLWNIRDLSGTRLSLYLGFAEVRASISWTRRTNRKCWLFQLTEKVRGGAKHNKKP